MLSALLECPSPVKPRIVFLSREPVVNQLGGSTTCALNLLGLLAQQGAEVTLVTTTAFSRSPRLWFTAHSPLPPGVTLFAPGYLRLGDLYLDVLSIKGWVRLLSRAAVRLPWLGVVSRPLQRLFGDRVYCEAWDLSPPTLDELEVAAVAVQRRRASTVVVNYAFWGPVFADPALQHAKHVVLMHDLLSARVKRFQAAGAALDCPAIEEETELSWLDRADCVLAAQQREAEAIRPKLRARVLVQPMVFAARPTTSMPERGRCLFVGGNIEPNRQGLLWFLAEVWPLVCAAVPEATLAVVGTVCASVPDGVAGVEKLGLVPELAAEYARAAVCVVPLRLGTGIKIKLLEALAAGKAVVSTGVGIEGLEQWAEGAIAVADGAAAMAAEIVRVLEDDAARRALEDGALRLITQHYSGALSQEFLNAVL